MPAHEREHPTPPLTVLADGEMEIRGRMPWSSNATFLVTLRCDDTTTDAIYKPERGERELWDFPDGLYRREVAAWVLSDALGWSIVPETIVRETGTPFGVGSLQRFVPADFSEHYFTLLEREDEQFHDALRTIAVFDILANNADRKGGHCLLGEDGRVWGIDNGLCFHPAYKLRTVIWDFVGEPIPERLLGDVARVVEDPPAAFAHLLHADEISAFVARGRELLDEPEFPQPMGNHPYPWPLV